jgi:putative transposase
MARKRRVLLDKGVYHVVSRGHNRYRLFQVHHDYLYYKRQLREYQEIFPFELFHYCFMPNHVHLALRILNGSDLPHLMQGINQTYSMHYKRTYGLDGNLFQGRYKAFFIDKDEYLMECGRYIERNSLRAQLIDDLTKYPYCSFSFYALGREDEIITSDPLYIGLSDKATERRRIYREYVLRPRPYETILDEKLKI